MSRRTPQVSAGDLVIRPATPDRWEDLVALFGTRGDPSWCWCQYFVTTGDSYRESADRNRAALHDQVSTAAVPPGLIAYAAGAPSAPALGWVQVGPRPTFPRVTHSRSLAQVVGEDLGDESVWRTTCFVVKVGQRRRGVARALLAGAIDFSREHGALALEAHPVDVAARSSRVGGAELYHGTLSMFLDAGFVEIGRTGDTRPVVRRAL
ncbi:MAG TPA: GNAT family N-acetyltransferase [Dermatophilaceae bacterium]|nr:GNAT family N-acetyltransferase [Dermatophilaceae bacterium]